MRKVLIIIVFICCSCEGSLDLEPKMFISSEVAFSNQENLEAALTGCYDALQLQHYYGRNLIIVGDLASDNSKASGTKIEYYSTDDNNLLSDNLLVEGIWGDIYTAVNRVNYVLFKLNDIDFISQEMKEDMQGQLSFLRALHYFNLMRLYGEVPLKLQPTLEANADNYLPRTSQEVIFNQIIEDLENASLLIQNQSKERATKNAAKALLSLVHLTRGKYYEAFEGASELYNSIGFLEADYLELFTNDAEPSEEILFFIPYSANDKNRLAEYHLPNQLGGRYENSPTDFLLSLIEEGDSRKDLIASDFNGKYYTKKYPDLSTGANNVIVLRSAELLFVMAEAAYHIDSVANQSIILEFLNSIRNRASLDSYTDVESGGLWQMIDREEQVEFAFEGKRWFDLLRHGDAVQKVSTVKEDYQTLFPIPLSEILANPEIGIEDQNPGY